MADVAPRAPARTYGRARPASPSQDGPSLFSFKSTMNNGASSSTSSAKARASPEPSPSKKLLNRFVKGADWKSKLAAMDIEPADDSEDAEALARTAQLLRRENRALGGGGVALPSPSEIAAQEAARHRPAMLSNKPSNAAARLGISFSSSSLSSAPPEDETPGTQRKTSTPPSSPPPARTAPDIVDNNRTVKATISGLFSQTSSPRPTPRRVELSRSAIDSSPGLSKNTDAESAGEEQPASGGESDSGSLPDSSPAPRNRKASIASSQESTPRAKGAVPRKSQLDDFMSTLREDSPEAMDEADSRGAMTAGATSGADALFDDEDTGRKSKKSRGPKALNKKDAAELRKDMDRAQRERYVTVQKVEAERFPITHYFKDFEVLKLLDAQNEPPLTRSLPPPPSSAYHKTPTDDIAQFTPSSPAAAAKGFLKNRRAAAGSSSPTGPVPESQSSPSSKFGKSRARKADQEDEDDDDLNLVLTDILKEDPKAAGRRRLRALKEEALQKQRAKEAERKIAARRAMDDDEDDLLEIVKDGPVPPAKAKSARFAEARPMSRAAEQDPHLALANYRSKHTGGTLPRGVAPKAAPKTGGKLTETHVAFAAKQMDHANLRQRNAGAKPAGQKAGRDEAIDRVTWEQQLNEQSRLQAARARQEKERQFGRGRVLPPKQVLDVQGLIQSSLAVNTTTMDDEDDEDEDAEDEDYKEDDDDEEDEGMAYSGEEEGGEDGEAEDEDMAAEQGESEEDGGPEIQSAQEALDDDEDKENQPIIPATSTADLERSPPLDQKMASANSASDVAIAPTQGKTTMQATPSRDPLSDLGTVPGRSTASSSVSQRASQPAFGGFGGLGGFGDDDDAGFSQMFEPTQVGSTAGEKDAFAGLRAGPQDFLLPANALLPQVNISDTQMDRDNALVAAEAEAEIVADRNPADDTPENLYLNDHGFFTQTKPADGAAAHQANRQALGPRDSTWTIDGSGRADAAGEIVVEDMQGPTTGRRVSFMANTTSPEPTERDDSSPEKRASPLSPGEGPSEKIGSAASPKRPGNALERMMAAAQRQKRREERRKEREQFRSNLVDEQAEESDEDNGWLPLGDRGDGEEEDGDDDGFVDGLVDDQVIDEEERLRQDELAEAKRREIELADDAKREEAARGVIAGEQRIKKRGADFVDGDEEDEQAYKFNKKQRKLIRKMRKGDEETALHAFLQRDVQDDFDSDGDDWESQEPMFASPEKMSYPRSADFEVPDLPTGKTRQELLQEFGRKNRGKNLDTYDEDQDAELFGRPAQSTSRMVIDVDDDDLMLEDASFTVTKTARTSTISKLTASRSTSSISSVVNYTEYVRTESQVNRRAGGAPGGVSVVRPSSALGGRPSVGRGPSTGSRTMSRQSTGSSASILSSRGSKFA